MRTWPRFPYHKIVGRQFSFSAAGVAITCLILSRNVSASELDGRACRFETPSRFILSETIDEGKKLVHSQLPIVALASCLRGRGPLTGMAAAYRKANYRILVDRPRLLVVELVSSEVRNRTIIVGNSRWRQFSMIYKGTPEVEAELKSIQSQLAVQP